MSVAETIREKLQAGLRPVSLDIRDESHLHQGHAGARPEGETHFRVEIVSRAFEGLTRVARQRRVYQILGDELAGPVHALALTAQTPAECEQGR